MIRYKQQDLKLRRAELERGVNTKDWYIIESGRVLKGPYSSQEVEALRETFPPGSMMLHNACEPIFVHDEIAFHEILEFGSLLESPLGAMSIPPTGSGHGSNELSAEFASVSTIDFNQSNVPNAQNAAGGRFAEFKNWIRRFASPKAKHIIALLAIGSSLTPGNSVQQWFLENSVQKFEAKILTPKQDEYSKSQEKISNMAKYYAFEARKIGSSLSETRTSIFAQYWNGVPPSVNGISIPDEALATSASILSKILSNLPNAPQHEKYQISQFAAQAAWSQFPLLLLSKKSFPSESLRKIIRTQKELALLLPQMSKEILLQHVRELESAFFGNFSLKQAFAQRVQLITTLNNQLNLLCNQEQSPIAKDFILQTQHFDLLLNSPRNGEIEKSIKKCNTDAISSNQNKTIAAMPDSPSELAIEAFHP